LRPWIELMSDTVGVLTLDQSDRVMRISAAVSGVPDISGVVQELVARERGREAQARKMLAEKEQELRKAVELARKQVEVEPGGAAGLRAKFDVLAVQMHKPAEARAVAEKMFQQMHDNANWLNNFAWALLTEDKYGAKYNDVALRFARRCNEITGHSNWAYVDTLALAEFEDGNAEEAIQLEQRAIRLCRDQGGNGLADLEKALARFKASVAAK
jgi:tetratricopeptide (TPR) repeat protein